MVILEITITSLIISICVAIIAAVIVYYKLEKKHKIRINELEYDIDGLKEIIHRLDMQYEEHIYRHH